MRLIYESMIKNLKLVPSGVNAKLLLRHSIRPETNKMNDEVDFKLGLTREGKELASYFGRFLGGHLDKDFKVNIKGVKSSKSPRCIETAKKLLQGYGKELPTIEERILHSMWIEDKMKWQKLFENYDKDLKILLPKMLNKENLDGVYPVNTTITKILLAMNFKDIAQGPKDSLYNLDVFVTHDCLIMLFLSFLFNKTIEQMLPWIYMLEGCILWFENAVLCIAWRGNIYRIELEPTILQEIKL
ncbi:histidine phosphatase family protein [Campylobacter troglodytis]|uniref:histidine phosphatase family protein n=1 Tax=Campylobacter troglodytis TaxID=654363 RepID=UPI001158A715|nr:histidine phosphatase family protein [Campylobacter troglodytis]TQR55825.1 hypothetical protein DMC01_09565 [Campylobacter troglodytis]